MSAGSHSLHGNGLICPRCSLFYMLCVVEYVVELWEFGSLCFGLRELKFNCSYVTVVVFGSVYIYIAALVSNRFKLL